MGARPYTYLGNYQPADGCVVEIGSDRGEGSTQWLFAWASRHGLPFVTADVDPAIHAAASDWLPPGAARLMPGADMLRTISPPIAVAYLDGFDWIPAGQEVQPWIVNQRDRYQRLGMTLANDECQRTHLEEAQLVLDRAETRCAIVMDDTWWHSKERHWTGKCGTAIPLLKSHGFKIAKSWRPKSDSLGAVVMLRG